MSEAPGDLVAALRPLLQRRPNLSISANLSVTVDGTRLAVSDAGDRLRVQVPSLRACLDLARGQRGQLPTLADLLVDTGQTVEVRVGDATVALVGAGASPGPVERRLAGPVDVRLSGAFAALLRLR